MTPDIDLSILIVNWNTRERTLACINSIRQFAPGQAGVQIIVIDKWHEDGSVEAIRNAGVDVELIENRETPVSAGRTMPAWNGPEAGLSCF